MNTLVIGDVHGHYDRLEALLTQEGIVGSCANCKGTGESGESAPWDGLCSNCQGDGIARINHDVKVVQLGDLAHNGSGQSQELGPYGSRRTVPGNATADMLCWDAAVRKGWCDVILWGNHDAAVFDDSHSFSGYIPPRPETERIMKLALSEGRLKLAYEVDGFLLTHAGLHKIFNHQKNVPVNTKTDPAVFAAWINAMQLKDETDGLGDVNAHTLDNLTDEEKDFVAIRDAISKKRGGWANAGGILWRDADEKLYTGYRQIFGHTKGKKIRKYETAAGWSFCIDVGDQFNGHLAGMWLPEEKIVEIKV